MSEFNEPVTVASEPYIGGQHRGRQLGSRNFTEAELDRLQEVVRGVPKYNWDIVFAEYNRWAIETNHPIRSENGLKRKWGQLGSSRKPTDDPTPAWDTVEARRIARSFGAQGEGSNTGALGYDTHDTPTPPVRSQTRKESKRGTPYPMAPPPALTYHHPSFDRGAHNMAAPAPAPAPRNHSSPQTPLYMVPGPTCTTCGQPGPRCSGRTTCLPYNADEDLAQLRRCLKYSADAQRDIQHTLTQFLSREVREKASTIRRLNRRVRALEGEISALTGHVHLQSDQLMLESDGGAKARDLGSLEQGGGESVGFNVPEPDQVEQSSDDDL